MLRLFRSSFWSSNLLNTSYPRPLVMSKCTMALPFRAESSSLVMYPCRLSELFVTPELWYLWLSGSGEADLNLFHGPYLVLQPICLWCFRALHWFICNIVACMDVVYDFLYIMLFPMCGVGTTAQQRVNHVVLLEYCRSLFEHIVRRINRFSFEAPRTLKAMRAAEFG